jgi:hypothetical protein
LALINEKLTASNRNETIKVEFEVSLPESISEALEQYGEEVCFYLLIEKAKTIALNSARGLVIRGTQPDEVRRRMSTWRPDKPLERGKRARRQIDIISIDDIDFEELGLGGKKKCQDDQSSG